MEEKNLLQIALELRKEGSITESLHILRLAVEEQNDPMAMFHLGFAYRYRGWGIKEKDKEKDELVYFFNGKYRCVECHPNVYCADADIHPCSSTYCDFISTGNSTGKAYPEIGLCCFTLGAKRCRSCKESVKEFNEENNFVIVT